MISSRPIILSLLGLVLTAFPSVGQSIDSTKVVFLETNLERAFVFADSTYLGRASQYIFNVPIQTKEIKLVPPDVGSWSITPEIIQIPSSEKDSANVEINFPYYYKIESVPYNASVYLEQPESRRLLGSTPLLYTSVDPIKGMILLSSDGYESHRLTPGEEIWNQHMVEMEEIGTELIADERFWASNKASKRWIDYTAAGVALVSGVLAIRYKAKANRRFDRYRISGDPALREGIDRYDRYSAISLGTMQAGIGVLAIRFVIK